MIYQEAPRRSLRYCSIDKDKGFWIEGKDYVAQDGDIFHFRFNV